jgi:phage replication-related protein YjqB (UPF0714/DUF867 family)
VADRFANYAELSAVFVEGTDYVVSLANNGSKNGVTAFHGGGIEIGTTELMRSITDKRPAWSWYSFETFLASGNSDLHITSVNYDEPRGVDWLTKIERAVSLHGASGDTPITYIGGLDVVTREFIKERLIAKGFVVEVAPAEIAGMQPENFVNRPKRHGVQLELTTQQRKSFSKTMIGQDPPGLIKRIGRKPCTIIQTRLLRASSWRCLREKHHGKKIFTPNTKKYLAEL